MQNADACDTAVYSKCFQPCPLLCTSVPVNAKCQDSVTFENKSQLEVQRDMINEQVKKTTRTKKCGCLPKFMFLKKKACTSAYGQVSSQRCCCVHAHVCAYVHIEIWVLTKIHVPGKNACTSAYGQVSSQGCHCVHAYVCAHLRVEIPVCSLVSMSYCNWPSQVIEVGQRKHEVLRERYIVSGQQKHWSQGIASRYLTEWTRSKWNHSGAPRMPGRKERQEERGWEVWRGNSTPPAVYEK